MLVDDKRSELHKYMQHDISYVYSANTVLARYWRLLLYDINIKAPTWEALLVRWQHECAKRVGAEKAEEHKGNIPKRLSGDVTWRFFCEGLTVLNFEDVVFVIKTFRGEDMKEFAIHIPKVYCESRGDLLRTLWDMINKGYPEDSKGKGWSKLMKQYSKKFEKLHGKVPTWLIGNMKRSLSADSFTWNTFHDGLQIYNFDQIDMELIVKPKRQNAVVVNLRLC